MPVLLLGGRVTPAPDAPNVLNTCQTPTEGLPGSPTVAIAIVTTPRFSIGSDEAVLVVVLEEDEPHAVAPIDSAVMVKARPVLPLSRNVPARTRAAIPRMAGSTGGKRSLSLRSIATTTVQIRKAATPSTAGMARRRVACLARSHNSPVVRSVRK